MSRGRKGAIPLERRPGWARRIVEARTAAGLATQEALAKRLERPQQTVAGWESGSSEPNVAQFEKLAAALDVSAAWLAFGADPDDDDSVLATFPGGQEQRRRGAIAVAAVAKMLNEEGLGSDLGFLIAVARKIALATQGIEDDLEAQQLMRDHIERERSEIRRGLDDLRKGRR